MHQEYYSKTPDLKQLELQVSEAIDGILKQGNLKLAMDAIDQLDLLWTNGAEINETLTYQQRTHLNETVFGEGIALRDKLFNVLQEISDTNVIDTFDPIIPTNTNHVLGKILGILIAQEEFVPIRAVMPDTPNPRQLVANIIDLSRTLIFKMLEEVEMGPEIPTAIASSDVKKAILLRNYLAFIVDLRFKLAGLEGKLSPATIKWFAKSKQPIPPRKSMYSSINGGAVVETRF